MEFDAVLEDRRTHWYVHVPALDGGSLVAERAGAATAAAALITATTGLPGADVDVTLHLPREADTLVRRSPTELEVRHVDGSWCTAVHVGWLRTWDGAWKALVCYSAGNTHWERAVHPSCTRRPAGPVPAGAGLTRVVTPRAAAETGPLRPRSVAR